MSILSSNKSNLMQIYDHLIECSGFFVPELDSYVDILEYSKKIFEKTCKIELFTNNILVGLLAFYVNTEDKNCFITNLSVIQSYQRQGIAKELLNFLKRECKKLGYKKIFLEVYKINFRAISFYKKEGFVVYSDAGNILVMEWR